MTKIHWCSGDVYLKDYINIDIFGTPVKEWLKNNASNPNETTLDNYYKYPFIEDAVERRKAARPFLIDKQADILQPWEFADNSVDEIVMISCIEHFWPAEIDHIISEVKRVLKPGGKWILDFPDIVGTVMQNAGKNDEHMITLLYCNHKNQYSIHHWGFTKNTFKKKFDNGFNIEFKDTVKHDYPVIGAVATKL